MHYQVSDVDTAAALGSGDLPVLATPRLLAWMEAATVQCAARFVEGDQTTVGTAVRIEHRRATPVGDSIEVIAEPPSSAAGRSITFVVQAFDTSGKLVAAGEIDRAIVNRQSFLEAASSPEAR